MPRFGDIDTQRLSLLLIAAVDLSAGGYVLIRTGMSGTEWRVNVRHDVLEHTSRAQIDSPRDRWPALLLALDRAVQWLAAARKDPRPLEG